MQERGQSSSHPNSILRTKLSRRNLLIAAGALAGLAVIAEACKDVEDSVESKLISIMKKVSGQEYVDNTLKGDIVVLQHLSIEHSTDTIYLVNDVYGKINKIGNFEGYLEYLLDRLDNIERSAIEQFLKESKAVNELPMNFGDRVYTVFFDPEPGNQKGLSINLTRGIPDRYSKPPLKKYLEAARYWTDIPTIYSVSGSNAVEIAASRIPDDPEHADMPKYSLSGSVTRELIIDVTHPKNRQRLEEIAASH